MTSSTKRTIVLVTVLACGATALWLRPSPANAWGLHDMHGNVWEWCRNGGARTPEIRDAPSGPSADQQRGVRGGCWHNESRECLSTARFRGDSDGRGSGLGFRVVLAATDPK